MELVGSDPAQGRAGHPPGICSCFLKTAPFIFLRQGLSTDTPQRQWQERGREGRKKGDGCLLEKHMQSRHRDSGPRGRGGMRSGKKENTGGVL